jgi:hypothetical protein
LDRDVTHRVKLVWLSLINPLRGVITLGRSEVLILMLEVWAITYVMSGLPTLVEQTGWKVPGLGDLLQAFLDEAEPLLLLFPS